MKNTICPSPPMNKAIAHLEEPVDLALSVPLPLTQHPAAVYLSAIAPSSRRTMRQSLNAIASMLTNGQCDAMTLDWSKLRYQHTAALAAVFRDKYAPATANRMLSALRRVLKEARRLKQMDADDYDSAVDFKGIKSTQMLRGRALSHDEIAALYSACMSDPTPKGVRDAAMISILMAGLRRSEAVNLDLVDFDPKTGGLTIRRGKGMKDRITYLPDGAAAAVEDWLDLRGNEPGPLLYPVDKAGRITTRRLTDQAVMFVLQKLADKAGVAAFSPHDFRRTFITQLLNTGADVITVSRLAGHADPSTTAKYDMRGEEVKRLAVARLKVTIRPRRSESSQTFVGTGATKSQRGWQLT